MRWWQQSFSSDTSLHIILRQLRHGGGRRVDIPGFLFCHESSVYYDILQHHCWFSRFVRTQTNLLAIKHCWWSMWLICILADPTVELAHHFTRHWHLWSCCQRVAVSDQLAGMAVTATSLCRDGRPLRSDMRASIQVLVSPATRPVSSGMSSPEFWSASARDDSCNLAILRC